MALPFQTSKLQAIQEHWMDRKVTNNVFLAATPGLKKILSIAEPKPGEAVDYPILTGTIAGAWRARGGQLTSTGTLTGAPATRVTMAKAYKDWPIVLADEDIDENKGSIQIANYLTTQLNILSESARQEMEASIWAAQTSTAMFSLVDAIGDATLPCPATYGGVTLSDHTKAASFIMESAHTGSGDVGVSPSLANVGRMVDIITMVAGEPPDAIFTQPLIGDILESQMILIILRITIVSQMLIMILILI